MSRAFAVLLVPAILVALSVAQGTSVQRDEDVLYKGEPAAYWFKLLKESDNPQQGKRPTQGELGDYEAKRNKAKEAAEALERIGPAAKAFVPGLIKLLKYRNPEERFFRRHVLEAPLRSLGAIGPDARDAIPEIV
ncbi:MAG: hypothetical protein HY000_12475, partial [Planctomycetes bacterium]|nr:hypothetical protein [Planctomycetota bacterium]